MCVETAKSPLELERAQEGFATTEGRLVERCLVLASKEPDGKAGLIALKMVACRSSKTEEGKKAAETLGQTSRVRGSWRSGEGAPFPRKHFGGTCPFGGADYS